MNRDKKPLPSIFITKSIVNERVKNYQDNRLPLLTNAIGKNDTKSAWYSLAQFEEMMRELYYQNADGIRVYFGAHPDTDPDYPKQLTVIFVPTHWDEDNERHTDVVIDEDTDFYLRTQAGEERLPQRNYLISKNLDTIALCPPSCDDGGNAYPF